jgi:hypothetical protein
MKSGFNRGARSVNVDWSVAWSGTEVARFNDMFRASDDTTNIRPGQEPISYNGLRGWTWLKLESRLGACLLDL